MESALKYVTDSQGNKQSVLVPISKWKEINEKYDLLLKKVKLMTEIKNGLEEVASAKKSGKKLQTLKSFLDESNG